MHGTGKVPFARKTCRHATGPVVRTGAGGAGNMRGGGADGGRRLVPDRRASAVVKVRGQRRPVAGSCQAWPHAVVKVRGRRRVPARRGPGVVKVRAAGGGFLPDAAPGGPAKMCAASGGRWRILPEASPPPPSCFPLPLLLNVKFQD